jgi:hypothetical protein
MQQVFLIILGCLTSDAVDEDVEIGRHLDLKGDFDQPRPRD